MAKNELRNVGTCAFCGQTATIETVGEVTQEQLDAIATDRCMCKEAQSEKRKKERRAKIDAYIKKHFDISMEQFVQDAVKIVEDYVVDKVSINYDSKTCTIWLDADSWLHLKIQHREDDELKV